MSDTKSKTTPAGFAGFVCVNKPSTKFKPEGEYSIKLVLDPATAEPLQAEFRKLAERPRPSSSRRTRRRPSSSEVRPARPRCRRRGRRGQPHGQRRLRLQAGGGHHAQGPEEAALRDQDRAVRRQGQADAGRCPRRPRLEGQGRVRGHPVLQPGNEVRGHQPAAEGRADSRPEAVQRRRPTSPATASVPRRATRPKTATPSEARGRRAGPGRRGEAPGKKADF
jgi:hypothetical protein